MRNYAKQATAALAAMLALTLGAPVASADESAIEANLAKIKLPPGFEISIYALAEGARAMAIGKPMGVVFLGTRTDTVYALVDRDKDRVADEVIEAITDLHVPNGIAFNAGFLYIAEQTQVSMYAAPEFDIYNQFKVATIYQGLPNEFLHGWRTLTVGPDNKLYLAVGAPCNICDVKENEGTIMRMNLDGSEAEVYARGVRNSVGMDFHPKTGELYFTDNGADGLGDNVPPDELNHAPRAGMFFGFPYFGGGKVASPGYEDKKPPQEVTMPVVEFGAHHAALGIHFYRGGMFPPEYQGDALIAQHGSWNRTDPAGYRIMRVRFDAAGKPVAKEVFAEGWLQGEEAWGRPVDIKELADGSLLVSDDYVGAVYRISYRK